MLAVTYGTLSGSESLSARLTVGGEVRVSAVPSGVALSEATIVDSAELEHTMELRKQQGEQKGSIQTMLVAVAVS